MLPLANILYGTVSSVSQLINAINTANNDVANTYIIYLASGTYTFDNQTLSPTSTQYSSYIPIFGNVILVGIDSYNLNKHPDWLLNNGQASSVALLIQSANGNQWDFLHVRPNASLTIYNLVLRGGGGSGRYGGGAFVNNGTLNLYNSLVENGSVTANGGAVWNNEILAVINTIFRNNSAGGWGGAIVNYTDTNVQLNGQCIYFDDNNAGRGGALYNANAAQATTNQSDFERNSTTTTGGAIFNDPANTTTQYTVSARTSWWNDQTGPSTAPGVDDSVAGAVDYTGHQAGFTSLGCPVPPLASLSSTATPTFTPVPGSIVVQITTPAVDGTNITTADQTRFQATAWNTAIGTTNGAGIQRVEFEIRNSSNVALYSSSDTLIAYCVFGGDGPCNVAPGAISSAPSGTYTIWARALTSGGTYSSWVSRTFIIGGSVPTNTPTRTPTMTPTKTPTTTLTPTPSVCTGSIANAQGVSAQACTGTGLYAEYFSNTSLTGAPVRTQVENVNYVPYGNPPAPGVPNDNFSVRWTGQIEIPPLGGSPQTYTFYTLSDDGVRLWINNTLIINNWTNHAQSTDQGTISLLPGLLYNIRLEYYDATADAIIQLTWSGPGIGSRQLIATHNLYQDPGYDYAPVNVGGQTWSIAEIAAIQAGVNQVSTALKFYSHNPRNSQSVFNHIYAYDGSLYGVVAFIRANSTTNTVVNPPPDVTITVSGVNITYEDIDNGKCKSFAASVFNNVPRPQAVVCNGSSQNLVVTEFTVAHELGHLFDYRTGNAVQNGIGTGGFALGSCPTIEFNGGQYTVIGFLNNVFTRGSRGWGTGPYLTNFQQSPENTPLEAAADMVLNWAYRRNSASGATPNIIVNTNGVAASGSGCIPIANQQGTFPSQNWNGFKNINWGNNLNDWGLPGDVRQAYMNGRIATLMSSNPSW